MGARRRTLKSTYNYIIVSYKPLIQGLHTAYECYTGVPKLPLKYKCCQFR